MWHRATILLLSVFIICLTVFLAARADTEDEIGVTVGFSRKTLVNVEAKDAISALNIYTEELGRQLGYVAQSHLYEDSEAMIRDMNLGKLDIAATSSLEYLAMKDRIDAELAVVHVRGGKTTSRYLVLSRTQGGPSNIDELKGKRIAILKGDDLSRLYLNTVLMKRHRSDMKRFFFSVEEKPKPSQVILSVFFNQTDACVVDDDAFRIISELNPQVGKKLRSIAASRELVNTVTFFRRGLRDDIKKKALEMSKTLKNTARGRQIFLLFKMTDVATVSESDLEGVRRLLSEHGLLSGKI